MRISDWSSDVCSSDLGRERHHLAARVPHMPGIEILGLHAVFGSRLEEHALDATPVDEVVDIAPAPGGGERGVHIGEIEAESARLLPVDLAGELRRRSEEHTSELQSLMRISYAVFCL